MLVWRIYSIVICLVCNIFYCEGLGCEIYSKLFDLFPKYIS